MLKEKTSRPARRLASKSNDNHQRSLDREVSSPSKERNANFSPAAELCPPIENDFDFFRRHLNATFRHRLPFENEFSAADLAEGGDRDCYVRTIVERNSFGQPIRRALASLLRGGQRMSVAVLISGSVFKEPTQRTSQSGKRYVVTTIKAAAADNTASDFWNVLAFGDTAGAELMRLAVGERLAVQGSLKIETYTAASDGSTKINRTVFVDHVLALRAPPREKKPKAAKPSTSAQQQSTAAPPFDDDVPFAPEVR